MSSLFSACVPSNFTLFSPSGSLILSLTGGCRITIRNASSLEVVQVYACVDKVNQVEWSADSAYFMCVMSFRSSIQVFSVQDPEWKCRINEGAAGLVSAKWFPNSRGIIAESDFGIHLSLWSLIDSKCSLILSPKYFNCKSNLVQFCEFSYCGKFLAVLHRIDSQDHIGIYTVNTLQEISKFKCRSNDVSYIKWSQFG